MKPLLLSLIFLFSLSFLIPSLSLAGYCSGNRCLPGPAAPGQTDCSSDIQCAAGGGIFGKIAKPPGIAEWGDLVGGGFVGFLNAILRLMIVAGGIWTLINIIVAGYQFISSGGKPESISAAWARIWQSLIGLLFIAGSFVLAAIFGQIIFGDATAIINPKLIGPN